MFDASDDYMQHGAASTCRAEARDPFDKKESFG